jgi:N6-L-threonylcarbamoyladenine synthase
MKLGKLMSSVKILAIDTSCDETSAAVVKDGRMVLSNIISSQVKFHAAFGGVVPEEASRKHIENIDEVVLKALTEAGLCLRETDAIAVTYGPGLVGALLTGLIYAKGLAYALKKPFIGVNHIEGHICSNYLETDLEPPFICLVVSGGHTDLVMVKEYGVYEQLGKTCDDAAGEAYDKIARVLGLGYPGGPELEKLALSGAPDSIPFPRASVTGRPGDFSFSGLKSAVLNYLNKCEMTGTAVNRADVAASFQKAVIDVLAEKMVTALKVTGVKNAALAGGVAANTALRRQMQFECEKLGVTINIPKQVYCTDNGAMIGAAAYFKYRAGDFAGLGLNAAPALKL